MPRKQPPAVPDFRKFPTDFLLVAVRKYILSQNCGAAFVQFFALELPQCLLLQVMFLNFSIGTFGCSLSAVLDIL